jgi:hypothetical protein
MKTPLVAGLALALGVSTAALAAPAQPDIRTLAVGQASPAATAEALNMIAGDWVAPTASIAFSRAQAGEIVGHLYIYEGGQPGLHELWTIRPKDNSLALYQVFFRGDLAPLNNGAWQERKLVAVDRAAGKVFFEGTTITVAGDRLQLDVRIGSGALIAFDFARVK